MDYQLIKMRARGARCKVDNFLALAPANDPFYVGRPSQEAAAKWFAELWQLHGLNETGAHLRRLHYTLVSAVPSGAAQMDMYGNGYLMRTDGKPYMNDKNSWAYLLRAGKWARYLGLVDPDHFTDRRNSTPIIGTSYLLDPTPKTFLADGGIVDEDGEVVEFADLLPSLPSLPSLPDLAPLPAFPRFGADGYYGARQYHVEVWAEKTTMNDVLEPLCHELGMNLITGMGELSITAVVDYLRRVREADVPSRILYIADYDPAGHQMPVSVARKIEFFQRDDPAFADLDIKLRPLVLTAEQVAAYKLPRIPVKNSDKRKDGWQANHGAGAVELDALEAIHPGTLATIVEDAANEYRDDTLMHRALQQRRKAESYLRGKTSTALGTVADDIARIEDDYIELENDFTDVEAAYNRAIESIQPMIDEYSAQMTVIHERAIAAQQAALDALYNTTLDITPYALPLASVANEPERLYESGRTYEQQIAVYTTYKNGGD